MDHADAANAREERLFHALNLRQPHRPVQKMRLLDLAEDSAHLISLADLRDDPQVGKLHCLDGLAWAPASRSFPYCGADGHHRHVRLRCRQITHAMPPAALSGFRAAASRLGHCGIVARVTLTDCRGEVELSIVCPELQKNGYPQSK